MESNRLSSFSHLSNEDSSPTSRPSPEKVRTKSEGFVQLPDANRLTIADRFMSRNYSLPTSSFPRANSTMYSISLDDPTSEKDKPGSSTRPTSPLSHALPASASLTNNSNLSPNDTSRLTIADRFMAVQNTSNDLTSSSNIINSYSADQVHPLDSKSEQGYDGFELHLDLSLPNPENYKRPFGSQDTLVGMPRDHVLGKSNLRHIRLENDEDNDEKASHCSSLTRHGNEESDMDLQQRKKDYSLDDGLDELERGFWIGNCCFISCQKQRPKQQTMIQKKKNAYKNAASPEDRSRGRRRCCVFLFFLAAVLLSLMSFLLWPRTPLIRVEGGSLISPVSITETGHGTLVGNVQFESQWLVHFTVDNRANWLVPTRFIQVHLLVKDALTGNIIGKGYQNDHPETVVLEPRTISNIQLAVALDYQARDFTDATFASLKSACISSSPSLPANNNTPNTNTTAPIINNGTIPIANATSTNTSTPTNSTNSTNANHLARRGPLDSDQHPASNVTTSNNSNTTQYPPIPNSHAPDQQQQPLSLLFWITLHIWGLDVFGYRPTVVATPANGGFLCPLS